MSPEFTCRTVSMSCGTACTHAKKKGMVMSRFQKTALSAAILLLLAAAVSCCAIRSRHTAAERSDFRRIDSETYDTALLSMFPVSTYPRDLFYDYRRMTVFAADYVLPDLATAYRYMDRIQRSGNDVSTVYLGILPDKVSLSEIAGLTAAYPDCFFELIMPCPFRDYWENLSDAEYARVLDAYCSCLSDVGLLTNARLYCYTPYEWMITNPALYEDTWLVSEDLGFFIVANTYREYSYLVTAETSARLEGQLRTLTARLRSAPPEYPDHSDATLVFFGDSIFGKYSGGMSIPGVISGLTNAATYNLGFGGTCASSSDQTPFSLPEAVTAFLAEDTSFFPRDSQAASELARYLSSAPADGGELCYVMNFGLNDYFSGCPVRSEDPYDCATYTGAIRTAVSLLRERSPQAQIILCTPNYSSVVPDAPPNSENLSDYADAVLALAEELDVDVADHYYGLGIDASNCEEYLTDGVHPNERCRFEMSRNILRALR